MGGGPSKAVHKPKEAHEVGEIDNSTGFHFVEVHAPSMSIGIGSIVFAIVLIGVAMIILQKVLGQRRSIFLEKAHRESPTLVLAKSPGASSHGHTATAHIPVGVHCARATGTSANASHRNGTPINSSSQRTKEETTKKVQLASLNGDVCKT